MDLLQLPLEGAVGQREGRPWRDVVHRQRWEPVAVRDNPGVSAQIISSLYCLFSYIRTSQSAIALTPPACRASCGDVFFGGRSMTGMDAVEERRVPYGISQGESRC